MTPLVWVCLAVVPGIFVLIGLSLVTFDRIVRELHQVSRQDWVAEGSPNGFFWHPPHSALIAGAAARGRCVFAWYFRTPAWGQRYPQLGRQLRRLRLYVMLAQSEGLMLAGLILWLSGALGLPVPL